MITHSCKSDDCTDIAIRNTNLVVVIIEYHGCIDAYDFALEHRSSIIPVRVTGFIIIVVAVLICLRSRLKWTLNISCPFIVCANS